MRRRAALAVVALAAGLSPRVSAEPTHAASSANWLGPVGIARVLIEARRDRVRVTTELTLPAAAERARPLSIFASYGEPGPPLALGAELVATPPGYLRAPDALHGEKLRTHFRPTAPDSAMVIVGRRHMAGSVVEIPEKQLAHALAASGSATLRIATVRAMPPPAGDGSRELLVRLGTEHGRPLVLGTVEVRGAHVARRDARLCNGKRADVPLAVVPAKADRAPLTPPPLAKRTARDDLCVRLWLDFAR